MRSGDLYKAAEVLGSALGASPVISKHSKEIQNFPIFFQAEIPMMDKAELLHLN